MRVYSLKIQPFNIRYMIIQKEKETDFEYLIKIKKRASNTSNTLLDGKSFKV